MFDRFDPDGSGQLDKEEFFAYAAKGTGDFWGLFNRGLAAAENEMDNVLNVFKSWDKDGDGKISREELERVLVLLNPSFTKKDMSLIMKAADRNKDGVIDFEEFAQWLKEGPPKKRKGK